MGLFVKTEQFTAQALESSKSLRRLHIEKHIDWVKCLNLSGINIFSGYLVDKDQSPGGGGLMIIEADNYDTAKKIISNDPMIQNKLVDWSLHEWIKIYW